MLKTMDTFSNFIKVGPIKKVRLKQIMEVYKNIVVKKGKFS